MTLQLEHNIELGPWDPKIAIGLHSDTKGIFYLSISKNT